MLLTFEDFHPGRIFETGWRMVTEKEIVQFSEEFDPQWFHADSSGRDESLYPTLIASGWHSGSICQRLLVDSFLGKLACLGSPGLDYLRWPAPLMPNDEVRAMCKVIEARPSNSRPTMGIVRFEVSLVTKEGKVVLEMAPNVFISKDSAAAERN